MDRNRWDEFDTEEIETLHGGVNLLAGPLAEAAGLSAVYAEDLKRELDLELHRRRDRKRGEKSHELG